MQSDLEIAQQAKLQRISQLAEARLGIPSQHLEPYGHYKAKLDSTISLISNSVQTAS